MFEKFGEFGSCEELNLAAAGLKGEGDIENIYVLATENGISREDAEDYIKGEIEGLCDFVSAAVGKLTVEKEKANVYEKVIADYLLANCGDEGLARAVRKKGKTIQDALKTMERAAKKAEIGNVAILTDKQGYAIVKRYYLSNKKGVGGDE